MRGRDAFAGRFGIWLRQYSDTFERDTDRILDTLRDFGPFDLLVQKTADGLTWQGIIDPLTPLRSLTEVESLQSRCDARGVAWAPVVVPRGRLIATEAAMHAAIARVAGALVTDIEPYEGFWDGGPTVGIIEYCERLREGAPDAYLVNQPDPRAFARREARVDETAHLFDALCPQFYVGWASIGWTDVDAEVRAFESLAALGRPMMATLYGVERTDLAAAFWRRVVDRTLSGHVFAFGAMNAAQLRELGALPRSPLPPEPPAPPEDLAGALGAIAAGLDDLSMRAAVQAAAVREYGASHAQG